MNNIKWIKISCDFFDDEAIKLIEQMPESDSIIVIWLKLLISAGKVNDKGYIYFKKEIPYTDEMLSAVFNRPLNIIRLAIQTFERFGMIQITDEQQIFISNWEKHQNIAGMEQIKEYNRMAKRRQREKEKEIKLLTASQGQCQGHVIDNHETDKEIDKDIEIEKDIKIEEEKKKNFVAKSFFQKLIADDNEIKKYSSLKDLFIEFLEYKTAIKKQFKTEKGVRNAFLDFVRLSKNGKNEVDENYARALVDNAIARNWQSIYDLPAEQKRTFQKTQNQNQSASGTDWDRYID